MDTFLKQNIDFFLQFLEVFFWVVAVLGSQSITVLGTFEFVGLVCKLVAEASALIRLWSSGCSTTAGASSSGGSGFVGRWRWFDLNKERFTEVPLKSYCEVLGPLVAPNIKFKLIEIWTFIKYAQEVKLNQLD